MLHGPAAELGKDNSIEKKQRLGILLFWLYLSIYAGFVVIGTLSPATLGVHIISGANLAIVYGVGLIALAAIMGLFYNHFCTRFENQLNSEENS